MTQWIRSLPSKHKGLLNAWMCNMSIWTQALETQWPRREDRRGGVRTARMADCNSESGDLGPQLGFLPASNVTLSIRQG